MYEEPVKRLRNAAEWADKGLVITPSVCLEAADAIEEAEMNFRHLERAYKELCSYLPKWIPVTERLPETIKERYWVCTDTGYQCECRWTNNIFGIGESDEWGWSIFDIPQYHKVVAWMLLPEPYKPPKEET